MQAAINDLDELNNQIGNSIVTRDIPADRDTAYTVSLDTGEVDRLGEGDVAIKATQTDAVGNEHFGFAKPGSFVIDTIDPVVNTITDNQTGIAFDGANTVTYTLTFSEPVQSVTESDLTVTGAAADAETGLPVYSVEHTAGANTAFVTVTVADDSMENVSITVNDSIKDIAGNPLIEATDNLQTVDTVNPSTTNEQPFVSDINAVITDADDGSTLTVSFTFDEDMDVTRDPSVSFDKDVASTLVEGTPQGAWEPDGRTFTVDAAVVDVGDAGVDFDAVKIDITGAYDVAGNLQADHTATVDLEIDTKNPTATYTSAILNQNQSDDVSSDDDSIVAYTVDFSEPVSGITAGRHPCSGWRCSR